MIRACLISAAIFASAWGAAAQSTEAATYGKALLQCYAAADDKLSCIGRTAEACMAREEGGDTTAGMVRCMGAETEIWDAKLNDEYKTTRAVLTEMDAGDGGARKAALLAAQRAWIAFRDAECGLEYAMWGAGSIRSLAGADCMMSQTAERTMRLIELRELVE